MHQNGHTSAKTSELDDQYAISFGLALLPEKPHEVNFSKELICTKAFAKQNTKLTTNGLTWVPMAPFGALGGQKSSHGFWEAYGTPPGPQNRNKK